MFVRKRPSFKHSFKSQRQRAATHSQTMGLFMSRTHANINIHNIAPTMFCRPNLSSKLDASKNPPPYDKTWVFENKFNPWESCQIFGEFPALPMNSYAAGMRPKYLPG